MCFGTGTIMFMTADRVDIMEFVSMVCDTKMRFVLRAPPLSYVSNIYYLPFNDIVWWCSIMLIFTGTIIVFFTYKLKRSGKASSELNFSDPWMIAINAVCGMEMEYHAKFISAKISTVNHNWHKWLHQT